MKKNINKCDLIKKPGVKMTDIKVTDVRCQQGDSAFLIDDGKTVILYDTGFGFTGFEVARNIKSVLGERPLDYIFLTHSHYDHALGSAYILRCYPEAKVVAGRYAAEIFKRDGAKRVMRELDAKFAATCGVFDYEFLGDELKVDIPVDDGDIITAGDMCFEVVELPGHTRCSVGYYCREKELLLSTETLGVYDGGEIIAPSYLVSYKMAIESIERVSKLKIKKLLVPHYGILSDSQTEYFLKSMKTAAENAAQIMMDGIKSGKTTEELIADFKERYCHGHVKDIYPDDAVNLNTSIMIELIKKELMGEQ